MMGIMERLTEKKEWQKKVFDDDITTRWREEAMAIPDDVLMKAAAAPSSPWERGHTGYMTRHARHHIRAPTKVKGIMSEAAFDYVSPLVV